MWGAGGAEQVAELMAFMKFAINPNSAEAAAVAAAPRPSPPKQAGGVAALEGLAASLVVERQHDGDDRDGDGGDGGVARPVDPAASRPHTR